MEPRMQYMFEDVKGQVFHFCKIAACPIVKVKKFGTCWNTLLVYMVECNLSVPYMVKALVKFFI